jgi:hypothetical protein
MITWIAFKSSMLCPLFPSVQNPRLTIPYYSSGIKRNKKACTECRQQKVSNPTLFRFLRSLLDPMVSVIFVPCISTLLMHVIKGSLQCYSRFKGTMFQMPSDELEVYNLRPFQTRTQKTVSCRRETSPSFSLAYPDRRLSELEQETYELRQRLESQTAWSARIPTPTVSVESNVPGLTPGMHSDSSPAAHATPSIVSPPAEDPQMDIKLPPTPGMTMARSIDGVTVPAAVIDELFQVWVKLIPAILAHSN